MGIIRHTNAPIDMNIPITDTPITRLGMFEGTYITRYSHCKRGDIISGFEVFRYPDDMTTIPGWFVLLPRWHTRSTIYELRTMMELHYMCKMKLSVIRGTPCSQQTYEYGISITVDDVIEHDPVLHIHSKIDDIKPSSLEELSDIYNNEESSAYYASRKYFITSARLINNHNVIYGKTFDKENKMYHMAPIHTGVNPLGLRLIDSASGGVRVMMPNFLTTYTFEYLQSFLDNLSKRDDCLVFVKAKSSTLSPTGFSEIEASTAEFIYDPKLYWLTQRVTKRDIPMLIGY